MFEPALLCPRVGLEPLAPWRRALADAFPEAERARFRDDPAALWAWVEGHIREEDDTYPGLPATPLGIFRLKAAAPGGREVLFCALCRSLGVPARLSCSDGGRRVLAGRRLPPRGAGGPPAAAVTLRAPAGQPGVFHQNYTLARRTPRGWETLATGDVPEGGGRQLSLVPGTYRLLTTQRLPAGDQLAQRLDFTLAPGEGKTFLLSFRQGRGADLLARLSLPPFTLCEEGGEELSSEALLRQSPPEPALVAGARPGAHRAHPERAAGGRGKIRGHPRPVPGAPGAGGPRRQGGPHPAKDPGGPAPGQGVHRGNSPTPSPPWPGGCS